MIFRKAVRETKIENLTFHDSRHEATTRLAKIMPPLTLARQLGHKDLSMLMIYYNETAAQIAKRMADVDGLDANDLETYLKVKRQLT